MDHTKCRDVLRKYFSNIVYIDDEFDTSLLKERFTEVEPHAGEIPLPYAATGEESGLDISSEVRENAKQKSNPVADFLKLLSCYPDVRLMPVYFDSKEAKDLAVRKMLAAPLTIIDWELKSGLDAYDVIEDMFRETKQLKVIVVYTNLFAKASDMLDEKLAKKEIQPVRTSSPSDRIRCVKLKNKSLIMVANKANVALDLILSTITNCFIDEYGAMPIALLDIVSQIEEKSGKLFGAFCAPVDGMYFLQSLYANESKPELQNDLTTFLLNKIKADVDVDETIISDITSNMRDRLTNVVNMKDAELSKLLQDSIDLLRKRGFSKHEPYCKELANIAPDKFKAIAKSLQSSNVNNWRSVLDGFSKYAGDLKGATDAAKGLVLPLFLQLLISGGDLLNSGLELIENMKYYRYGDSSLNGVLKEAAGEEKEEQENIFDNKLHFGDILVNNDRTEFLLCITPPCDIYRPSKTEFNISYIAGRRATEAESEKDPKELKDGQLLCSYPDLGVDASQRKIIYIIWQFYRGVRFDLRNTQQLDELCAHTREYRLEEQYARQIANQYLAYYSRAGVNELFMDKNKSLRDIW